MSDLLIGGIVMLVLAFILMALAPGVAVAGAFIVMAKLLEILGVIAIVLGLLELVGRLISRP